MKPETCKTCKFYELQTVRCGACLRYPPAFFVLEGSQRMGVPITQADSWCGEWKARPARKAAVVAKKKETK